MGRILPISLLASIIDISLVWVLIAALTCFYPERILAGGVAVLLAQKRQHLLKYDAGYIRYRSVVNVNQGPAFSKKCAPLLFELLDSSE